MQKRDFVYIVEDDPISATLIRVKVEKHPLITQNKLFENGQVALEDLKSRLNLNQILPNLILLDINMPVMDAWEFLDSLTEIEKAKQIPVILLTSSVDPNDTEKSKKYTQIRGYYSKPLTKERLNEILSITE